MNFLYISNNSSKTRRIFYEIRLFWWQCQRIRHHHTRYSTAMDQLSGFSGLLFTDLQHLRWIQFLQRCQTSSYHPLSLQQHSGRLQRKILLHPWRRRHLESRQHAIKDASGFLWMPSRNRLQPFSFFQKRIKSRSSCFCPGKYYLWDQQTDAYQHNRRSENFFSFLLCRILSLERSRWQHKLPEKFKYRRSGTRRQYDLSQNRISWTPQTLQFLQRKQPGWWFWYKQRCFSWYE